MYLMSLQKNVTFIDFLWHDITSYYFLSFFSFDLFLLQYKLVQRMLEQGSNPGVPLNSKLPWNMKLFVFIIMCLNESIGWLGKEKGENSVLGTPKLKINWK